jgi:hypothetical protein
MLRKLLAGFFQRTPEEAPPPLGDPEVLALEVGGSGPHFIGCLDRLVLGSERRAILFDGRGRCIRFTWSSQIIPYAAVAAVQLQASQRGNERYELRFSGTEGLLLSIDAGRSLRGSDRGTLGAIEQVARTLAAQVGV